VYEGLSI
jgi:MFS family permease